MKGPYIQFLKEIRSFIPEDRIYTDELRRLTWGTDAGFYRLVPEIVIRSKNEKEVSDILRTARSLNLPVTFRAAGTSLSGQTVSDSILVVAGKNWEKYSVSDDRETVTLQPGIIGARVNDILHPLGRHFGPDPASIKSAMVGGILMNNASGMSCGTFANSDKLLVSARIVFTDGTVLDTGDEESRKEFAASHGDFLKAIEALRDEVLADGELTERIRFKYSIKNVTGLNILPFISYTDPFDIIAHLMAGSEGTLGFVSEVTMKTLPLVPFRASAMIYFTTIRDAAEAVVAMKKLKINAAELLDKRSLMAVGDTVGKEVVEGLSRHPDLTAVLTETEADSKEELRDNIDSIMAALAPFKTFAPVKFTDDPAEYSKFWAVRSGIFPSVGGMRETGTTCLIEDVAFHIEQLPDATVDLSELLDRHGYMDSCIYGHALEGNFHFIINQAFNTVEEVERYKAMILDVADLVVNKYDGSLKAEHGTGRNMAPFVKMEWGEKAYGLMKRVKNLFDPLGLLNPGVIFNDDPECYIKNFKALPVLSPASGDKEAFGEAFKRINKCIECGFCEVNCLSCGFTLSSRTRIVANREMARLAATGENPELLSRLKKQYLYAGNRTCAGDGLCSTSCPMGINTGDLTHDIRASRVPEDSLAYKAGDTVAKHFSATKEVLKGTLALARFGNMIMGDKLMGAIGRGLHAIGLPLWTPAMPSPCSVPEKRLSESNGAELKVVYFPSCINQMMGTSKQTPGRKPLAEEMTDLLHKAGYDVIFPEGMKNLCCGTIWESKGMPDIADRKVRELEDALWRASGEGKYPVLCDQSPCMHRMKEKITKMKLYEPAEFIWEFLRDRLEFHKSDVPVAVHRTCSTKLMGLGEVITGLAGLCAGKVFVPEGVGCCGFAGDKGMTHPELNAYALRKLRSEIEAFNAAETAAGRKAITAGYTNSRTCEIGLTTNSGIPYMSIVYLVNECTSAKRSLSE